MFGEEDLLIGFRLGPQVTNFSPIQTGPATVDVPAAMRFVAGAAFKFVYGLPRFELDVLLSARGWVNTDATLYSVALPLIGKIPLELEKGLDIELGLGWQQDLVLGGADPHKSFMNGALASLGFSVDFEEYIFDFDVRYVMGFEPVSDKFNGARHRDFQAVGGLMWHF